MVFLLTCYLGFTLCRCPACQRFQPEYEKVAAFFAERGEKEPVVTVARLDCANFVSSKTASVVPLSIAAGACMSATVISPCQCASTGG
jgi:hypothetical protein